MAEQADKTILAVDVANGLTRLGIFRAGELVGAREFSTPRHLTLDEARSQAREVLGQLVGDTALDGTILSSVVPTHTDAWTRALASLAHERPLLVGPGLKTGIRMRVGSPSDVGSDRIANVVAARELHGSPVVVVSVGTTTNLEVVDASGSFVGGIIAPGIMLGVRALAEAAARLPMVELRIPTSVVGKSTREAIQSGVVLGEAARIDGLIDAICTELGCEASVVVTGHHAELVAPLLRHVATHEEELTLRGLALIWQTNRS